MDAGFYTDTDWQAAVQFKDRDDNPIDLTDRTFNFKMYRYGLLVFICDNSLDPATNGSVDMSQASAGVVIINATETQHAAVEEGVYKWECRQVIGPVDHKYIVGGKVTVLRPGGTKESEFTATYSRDEGIIPYVTVIAFKGDRGTSIIGGEGPPSDADDGSDGDYYIDELSFLVYGPKTDGAWGDAKFSMRGPAGAGDTNSYETLADLKAAELTIGSFATTRGYTSVGDFGDSYYEIVAPGTGVLDEFRYVAMGNGNQAKLILADPTTVRIRQTGAKADGSSNDAAKVALIEASGINRIDLTGLTVDTLATSDGAFTRDYYGGAIYKRSATQNAPMLVRNRWPIQPNLLSRHWTKTPLLDHAGRRYLVNGTSIPAQGLDLDSYFTLACDSIGADCRQLGWAGSKNCFDPSGDAFDIATVKCLSMTEDDRLAGIALYGEDSAYSDDFPDIVNKASRMTADYRIKQQFIDAHNDGLDITVAVLDHNHNDRGRPAGTLTPDSRAIGSVTLGSSTIFVLVSNGLFAIGDAIGVRIQGIGSLDYHCARVQAVSGNNVSISLDSSAYSGSFVSGTAYKLDRASIFGAWQFTTWYYRWCANVYGSGEIYIILCSSPSEYTGGPLDYGIVSVNELIYQFSQYHSLSFFDLTAAMEIDGLFNTAFLQDTTHPLTTVQRQAIANYWAAWLQGGTPRTVAPDEYLRSGANIDYADQRFAIFSRFEGGFTTASVIAGEYDSETDLLGPDYFAGGTLGTWATAIGMTTPTVVVAPWDAGINAALFHCEAGALRSGIQKSVTPGDGRVVEFDFYAPVVSGLLTERTDITICDMRSGGAYLSMGLVIDPDQLTLFSQYFEVANIGPLHRPSPRPINVIEAGRKYTLRFESVAAISADLPGSLIIYLDGVKVGGPYKILDFAQTPVAQVRFGILSNNFNIDFDFDLYMSGLRVGELQLYDVSSPFTGNAFGLPFAGGLALAGGTLSANLQAFAGLTGAANKGVQFTGLGALATYDLSAAGKALIDDADAAAQRATLGLGSVATQAANAVALTGGSAADMHLSTLTTIRTTALTLTGADNGTCWTNVNATALVVFTLPTPVRGYEFEFVIADGDGIKVQAAGTDLIRYNGSASSAGGYIQSLQLGSSFKLKAVSSSTWVVSSAVGSSITLG
jgi:hypothetical protein